MAFEMARQLTGAGESVGLLALIDTRHPRIPMLPMTMAMRFARLRDERWGYLVSGLLRQMERARLARDMRLLRGVLQRGEPVPFALRELHLRTSFRAAVMRYKPQPWPGKATLFHAMEVAYVHQAASAPDAWSPLVLGGLEVVPVPGDHHTLLLGMKSELLIRSLREAIERAQTQASAPSSTNSDD